MNSFFWGGFKAVTRSLVALGLAAVLPALGDARPAANEFPASLAVTISDAVDPVVVGHELTYTVAVRNLGDGAENRPPITGQTVTVTLPAAAQFVSAAGGVLPIDRVLTFANVVVPPEGTHLEFSVKYPVPGTNTVAATVTDPGPITADNSAAEPTVVVADSVPVISVADVVVPEGDAGLVDHTVIVRVDPAPADSLSFYYSTAAGTAAVDKDFKGVTNGIVFIQAGSTQVPLRVQVIGNALQEPDRNFSLVFAPIPGVELAATFARTSATVTIQNDDVAHRYADLAIQLSGSPDPVTAGSELEYRVAVTNLGPEAAPGFFVRNTLPSHVLLKDAQPSLGSIRHIGQDVEWTMSTTVASGAGAVLLLQVVPDRAGVLTNLASVAMLAPVVQPTRVRPQGGGFQVEDSGPTDPVAENNSATLLTTVLGGLTVENLSTNGVALNRQTGLFEQRLRVRNASAVAVAGARVLLRGLAAGVTVRNAAGTDDGVPFVDVKRFIAAAEEVELRVEYYVATRVPPTLPTLEIRSNPTAAPPAGTNAVPTLSARAVNGRFLLEFLSAPQGLYAIEYSDLHGTNVIDGWKRAVPQVTARANAVQWFDDGPPKTETPPSNRIYRVRLVAPSGNINVPNP